MTENVIACGVDGSDNSRRAAVWAADWAQATGCSLKLVTGGPVQPVGGTTAETEKLQAQLQERLDAVKQEIADTHPGLEVIAEAETGSPVTALLRESKSCAAVVIGTKGRGGWKGLQAGSVSGAVSAQGYGPTVVVPMQADATFSRDGDIVIGFDGLEDTANTVELALTAAKAEGRKVRLVRSVKDQANKDDERAQVERAVEEMRAQHEGVEISAVVDTMDPAELMARESEGAALTIIESRGYGGIGGFLLGPTATMLVQLSHSPVMVLTSRSERIWPLASS